MNGTALPNGASHPRSASALAWGVFRAWLPLVLTLIAWRAMSSRVIEIPIAPSTIVHERGALSSAPLSLKSRVGASTSTFGRVTTTLLRLCFVTEGDRADRSQSTLVLFVDGRAVGPAHAEHESIAREGNGRYSHWGNRLFFSLPKNATPSVEPTLIAVMQAPLRTWLVVTMALTALVAALQGWRRTEHALASALPAPRARRARACLALTVASASSVIWLNESVAAQLAWWAPPLIIAFALAAGFAGTLARALNRGSAMRVRLEVRGRHALEVALIPLCVCVAMSSLTALRAGELPGSLPGAGFSLRGMVHLSDTSSYEAGAEAVLAGKPLPVVAARRPVLAASQAALLTLGGASGHMLVAQALALALALGALGLILAPRFGVATALGASMAVLAWMQGALATAASEPLGCAFGAAAFALLLRFTERRSLRLASLGLVGFVLSALVRPGALFAIPLVALSIIVQAGRGRRRLAALVVIATIALVALLPTITARALSSTGGATNANFSHTLLGLALGGDWRTGDDRFGAELALLPTEREQSEWRLRKARELIRDNPRVFLGSLGRSLTNGLVEIPMNAWHWSRVSTVIDSAISAPTAFGTIPTLATRGTIWRIAAWSVMALWLASAIIVVARRHREPALRLMAMWLLGVVVSLPIIWTDGGWRSLAGALPLFAVLLMLPAWAGRGLRLRTARGQALASALAVAVLALAPAGVMIALAGAALTRTGMTDGFARTRDAAASRDSIATRDVHARGSVVAHDENTFVVTLGPAHTWWQRNDGAVPSLPPELSAVTDAMRADPTLIPFALIDLDADRLAPALVNASIISLPPGRYRLTTELLAPEAAPWRRVTAVEWVGGAP